MRSLHRTLCAASALALAGALALPLATHAEDLPGAIVDGPSARIVGHVDLDRAPDGTAGVAYVKQVGGTDRIFASVLDGSAWTAPVRIDTGLSNPSRAPAVAASNGGRVVVAFLNGAFPDKRVYSVRRASTTSNFAAPVQVAGDDAYDLLDIDASPSAIAFATFAGQNKLFASRLQGTTWTGVGGVPFSDATATLNADPTRAAAEDAQRGPSIAVSNAGEAVVAWTEEGAGVGDYAVFARRLTGTAPSDIGPARNASVDTLGSAPAAGASDMVDTAVAGDGRGWVAFRQFFEYPDGMATKNIPRALARPLDGDAFGAAQVIDGLPASPTENGAEFPSIAVNDAGLGVAASRAQLTFVTWASSLDAAGIWSSPAVRADQGLNPDGGPEPQAAIGAASNRGVIAWRNRPPTGQATAVAKRTQAGVLGELITLSRPDAGDTEFSSIRNGADAAGNAAVAFTQLDGTQRTVVGALVSQPSPAPPPAPTPAPAPAPATPSGENVPAPAADPAAAPLPLEPSDPGATWGDRVGVRILAPERVTAVSRTGRVRFRLRNANAFPVTGRLSILSGRPPIRGGRAAQFAGRRRQRVAHLGSTRVAIPANSTRTATIAISRRNLRLLRQLRGRRRAVPVYLRAALRAPSGVVRVVSRPGVLLRLPRAR